MIGALRRVRRRFLPAHIRADIRDTELLVALLELGSSLGLFISLKHGELSAAVRDHKAAPVATSPKPAQPKPPAPKPKPPKKKEAA